ncbi:MAG: hypothetical protein CMK06_11195 [Ponticaulis sp.]|nr:hypothetical protein [Ponticaulis sp.]
MRLFSHASAALAVGVVGFGSIASPALAQDSPLWSASDANLISDMENLRNESAGGSLSTESSVRALLSNLPDMVSVNFGGFESEGDGVVATNVELTLGDEMPLGFRIGELRVYGLSDGELNKLAEGETARIGSRIDARNVVLFGLENYVEQAAEAYVDQLEGAIEGIEDADVEASLNTDFKINDYSVSVGQIVVDGLVWHETPEGVDAGIDSLLAGEAAEGQEAWALFAPIARLYRNMETDQVAYYDMDLKLDMVTLTDGMEQNMDMEMSMPFSGISGVNRGDYDVILYRDVSYDMSMDMQDDETGLDFPMEMGGSMSLGIWEGVELGKLFSFLEKQEVPSTDVTDLMSLGKLRVFDETSRIGGEEFYSVAKSELDLSEFHWFVPEKVSMMSEGLRFNIGNYMDFVKQTMMTMPEVTEDADAPEILETFDDVLALLEEQGVDVIEMDVAFDMNWDAETGATELSMMNDAVDLGEFRLAYAGSMPKFDDAVAAMKDMPDESESEETETDPFEELFTSEMTLTDFDLSIDDDGGLEKMFALAVGIAKIMPEDNQDMAMLRQSSPEELRGMASSLTRMTGFQAASVFPPAVEYINGFADFILNGGMVSLSVSPMEPLSAETAPQIEALMADPDGLVDYLGLEFVYEAPEEAEAE